MSQFKQFSVKMSLLLLQLSFDFGKCFKLLQSQTSLTLIRESYFCLKNDSLFYKQ